MTAKAIRGTVGPMRRWLAVAVVVLLAGAGTGAGLGFSDGHSGGMSAPGTPGTHRLFAPIAPVVARPSHDFVASSARSVVISWSGPHRGTLRVQAPARVRRLSQLLNSLPEEGKGECAEGLMQGPPFITFAFRDAAGRLVARATEINSSEYPVAWCVPTTFLAPGRRSIRLEGGGYLLKRARQLLGRSLR